MKRIPLCPVLLIALFLLSLVPGEVASSLQPGGRDYIERDYYPTLAAKYNAVDTSRKALPNGTYCDLQTDTEAIEVDFSNKWAEAVGQSLSYSLSTGKKPAIILLIDVGQWHREARYIDRCRVVCEKYSIKLYQEQLPMEAIRGIP